MNSFKLYVSLPGGSVVKICLQCRRPGFYPWVEKIPWRRAWQPTPVLLSRESHGQRLWWAAVHRVAQSHTWLMWLSGCSSKFYVITFLWICDSSSPWYSYHLWEMYLHFFHFYFHLLGFIFLLFSGIVDLQCYVNLCYTMKWFSYTHIYIFFSILSIMVYHRILNIVLCTIE